MLPTPVFEESDDTYPPNEDSFLLLDALEQEIDRYKGAKLVVEVGTGTGLVLAFLQPILKHSLLLATDINPYACEKALQTCKLNSNLDTVDAIRCSLAAGIRTSSVDLLVFNPPYVPSETLPAPNSHWVDFALDGGQDGMEVTWILLNNLENILSAQGVAYILFCARNHPEDVAKKMESRGWKCTAVITRKTGWEVLSVLRIERSV